MMIDDEFISDISERLLFGQKRLGLKHSHIIFIMILLRAWRQDRGANWPLIGKADIADIMNVSTKQIQRYGRELGELGLVQRLPLYYPHGLGIAGTEYDLTGLLDELGIN